MSNLISEAMQSQINRTQTNQQINNPMAIVQAIRASRNPNMMLQQLAQTNPNVASAMNLIRQYGGDPQKAFYEEARKRGVDPNQIIGMLR